MHFNAVPFMHIFNIVPNSNTHEFTNAGRPNARVHIHYTIVAFERARDRLGARTASAAVTHSPRGAAVASCRVSSLGCVAVLARTGREYHSKLSSAITG